jgi:hypothetical protein
VPGMAQSLRRGAGRCSKPSKLVLHPSAIWIKKLGKIKLMILSNVPVDLGRYIYESPSPGNVEPKFFAITFYPPSQSNGLCLRPRIENQLRFRVYIKIHIFQPCFYKNYSLCCSLIRKRLDAYEEREKSITKRGNG